MVHINEHFNLPLADTPLSGAITISGPSGGLTVNYYNNRCKLEFSMHEKYVSNDSKMMKYL